MSNPSRDGVSFPSNQHYSDDAISFDALSHPDAYAGYWGTVLGANRSASEVVAEFDLGPDERGLDEWLNTAETEAWRVGGLGGQVPAEWGVFHTRALAELLAYAKRAADSEEPVEGEWNVYVWPTESGADAYCVGHEADKHEAFRVAKRVGAAQIQFGLLGEILSVSEEV